MPLILIKKPCQNNLKWLWTDLKSNSSTEYQNVDSSRVVIQKQELEKVYIKRTTDTVDTIALHWYKQSLWYLQRKVFGSSVGKTA